MQILRAYITKLVIIALLWVGLGFYIAQPFEAGSYDKSFASWLDEMVEQSHEGYELEKARHLTDTSFNIGWMAKSMSFLLEDGLSFLPVDKKLDTKQFYNLLLEWGYQQTGKGMSSVPPTVQPLLTLQIEKYGASVPEMGFLKAPDTFFSVVLPVPSLDKLLDFSLSPMAEGIAIGAP